MDLETLSKIGIVVGFLGMFVLWVKNLPLLGDISLAQKRKESFSLKLEKILSKLKLLLLRLENKVEKAIRSLRAQRQNKLDDNYWEKLKED